MIRRLIFICLAIYVLSIVGLSCSKKEPEATIERTESAVSKAADRTGEAVRDVVEGVNDAVYK